MTHLVIKILGGRKECWKFATGDATDIIAVLKEVLEIFETMCLDKWRGSLNRDVARKLAQVSSC